MAKPLKLLIAAAILASAPRDAPVFQGVPDLTAPSSVQYSSAVNEICGLEDVGSDPLVRTLLGAAHRLESRVELALSGSGLSLTKLGILHHLVHAGEPLQLSRLADRISCVKSNITQVVDRLEAEGLVRRVSDPEDRRSIRAEITDEGQQRYTAGAKILEDQEEGMLRSLHAGEREQLSRLLTQLCQ